MRVAVIALLSLSALTFSDAVDERAVAQITVSGRGFVDMGGMACRDAVCEFLLSPSFPTLRLIAEQDAGAAFLGWSGDCTGTARFCEIGADGAVTATFSSELITVDAAALADAKVAEAYTGALAVIGETGPAPASWFLLSGELPAGLSLESATGIITGVPEQPGEFVIGLLARSDVFETRGEVNLTIVEPDLSMQDIVDHLAGSSPADAVILRYLDAQGNLNGSLDIGDIAAWLERP